MQKAISKIIPPALYWEQLHTEEDLQIAHSFHGKKANTFAD